MVFYKENIRGSILKNLDVLKNVYKKEIRVRITIVDGSFMKLWSCVGKKSDKH